VRGDGGPDRVGNRHVRRVLADGPRRCRFGQPGHVETGGGERSRRRGAHEKSRRRRGGF
jgi:hypothetical protein